MRISNGKPALHLIQIKLYDQLLLGQSARARLPVNPEPVACGLCDSVLEELSLVIGF